MANSITILRVLIIYPILVMLKLNPIWNLLGIVLIMLVMLLDAIDGLVARYLNTSSLEGSVYDILADRIIENTFFVFFAVNHLFDFWFTMIVLVRGLVIDSIRSMFAVDGKTAFGKSTLHSSKWAIFVACSKISRGLYNTFKMLTFICFAAQLQDNNILAYYVGNSFLVKIAYFFLWSTIAICLIRSVPVLCDGFKSLKLRQSQL